MLLKKMSPSMTPFILLMAILTLRCSAAKNILCTSKVCECETRESELPVVSADCSRVWLSIVPPLTDWPVNVTHMDLSSNNITELDFEMSHDTLQVLVLSHNGIRKVVQNAFGGLGHLRTLDLADNAIVSFEDNGFYGLDHLISLNLSSNGLNTLPVSLFANFIWLQELSLSDNPLVHIDPMVFNRMISLRWLDLSNTGLYTLLPITFHPNSQLEFLDVSLNDFHDVPTDALRSAKNLRHLRLNENPIDTLGKKSFIRLENLEVLELNNLDYLREVPDRTFSHLVKLRVLEMRYNRHLWRIHRLAFDGLFNGTRPVLQELDLEGNSLHAMDKDTVACAKMRKFNVQKNPWNCDCGLQWIKQCQIQDIYEADLRCHEPSALQGSYIANMEERDFECLYSASAMARSMFHHEHVVRSVSVGLAAALLVMLAFGVALIIKWKDIKTWYSRDRRGTGSVYYVRARRNPREI